jgi:hypothetical protein
MKKLLLLLLILCSVHAFGSELQLSIAKQPVSVGEEKPLLYVRFAGDRIQLHLLLIVSDLHLHPIPAQEEKALRTLPEHTWTDAIHLTVHDVRGNRDLAVPTRTLVSSRREAHGPDAVRPEWRSKSEYLKYEADIDLGTLPPADYEIGAALGGLHSSDHVLISNGTESPQLRFAWLGEQAARAKTYDEYRRLQIERAAVEPYKAAPYLELGQRAMRDGSLEQASEFFRSAVAAYQLNIQRHRELYPMAYKPMEESTNRAIGGVERLQKLLPQYFARRGEVSLAQVHRNGETHWILKDKQGNIVHQE